MTFEGASRMLIMLCCWCTYWSYSVKNDEAYVCLCVLFFKEKRYKKSNEC